MTYSIPVSNGLLTPEHREAIGPAIWVFLWMIDATTKDEPDGNGGFIGIVKGGKPVPAQIIAEQLGEHPNTIRRHLKTLSAGGYIRVTADDGEAYSYAVLKSKKWTRTLTKNGEGTLTKNEHPPSPKMVTPLTKNGIAPNQKWVCNKEDITDITDITEEKTLSSTDSRYRDFVEDLSKYHAYKNPGLKFHFNAVDGKALTSWLKENRDIDREQWQEILQNRARSPGISHAAQFHTWAGRARQYLAGPLDKFWNPVTLGGNGNGKPDKDSIIAETGLAALAERERTRRMADGENCQDAGGISKRAAPKQAGNFGVLV